MDITYAFGVGDGELTEWTSPADVDIDGDGVADAVALDFDGDGLIDDVLWDADGDGVADAAGLDVDALAAGGTERWFTDPDALGTWPEHADRASIRAAAATSAGASAASAGVVLEPGRAAVVVDSDGDGAADTRVVDTDGDGHLDTIVPLETPAPADAAADPALIAGASVRRWQGDASS